MLVSLNSTRQAAVGLAVSFIASLLMVSAAVGPLPIA